MNSAHELVAIVDEENRVVGSATRRKMREGRLRHRSTYILVFNSRGNLFVHQRTQSKDVYPGYYDVAAGGVVLSQESYEEGAKRELEEELGIRDVPLERLFDFYFEDTDSRVFGAVFVCVYDGALTLQAEEIKSGRFMVASEVAGEQSPPFTPDGLYVLRGYLDRRAECEASP